MDVGEREREQRRAAPLVMWADTILILVVRDRSQLVVRSGPLLTGQAGGVVRSSVSVLFHSRAPRRKLFLYRLIILLRLLSAKFVLPTMFHIS